MVVLFLYILDLDLVRVFSYMRLWLHAGRRVYAGREMPGLGARIWYCFVSLLLVAALPWTEPEVMRRRAPETSNNKKVVVVELGFWVPLRDLVVAVAEDGEGWSNMSWRSPHDSHDLPP